MLRQLLDRFRVEPAEIPVVICRGEAVLKNPSNQEIADCLGFNKGIDTPTGAMSSSSRRTSGSRRPPFTLLPEGLDVLVIEASSPGGQAASSSKIENYLGFQREFQVAIWPDAPTPKHRSLARDHHREKRRGVGLRR